MDIKNYGKVISISGALFGLVAIVYSAFLTFLQSRFDYLKVMTALFSFCIFLIPLLFLVTASMKDVENKENETKKINKKIQKDAKINLLRYKPFYILIIPNFLRGFCAGIVNISVTIGYYTGILDQATASVLVIITNIMMLASCVVYPAISKRFGEHNILLVSGIAMTVFMPFMVVGNNTYMYLIFYAMVYFFFNLINYAVPVAVTQIVDYNIMGQYSAWRLLLNAIGIALSGFVCVGMIDMFGTIITMIIAALCQLYCSIVYWKYMKNCLNNVKE